MVPRRRSSARHFIVSSGTMKNTGNQKSWKKTTAGGGFLRGLAVALEDAGEDEAHEHEKGVAAM
jgi:hypothetical protein